jgi:hypothetical protein
MSGRVRRFFSFPPDAAVGKASPVTVAVVMLRPEEKTVEVEAFSDSVFSLYYYYQLKKIPLYSNLCCVAQVQAKTPLSSFHSEGFPQKQQTMSSKYFQASDCHCHCHYRCSHYLCPNLFHSHDLLQNSFFEMVVDIAVVAACHHSLIL